MTKIRKALVLALILIVVLSMSVGIVVLTMSGRISKANAATQADISNAINKGIAWLAAQQNPDGYWEGYRVGQTGLAVMKLETYAIDQGKDPLDPSYVYYTNVSKGLDYIFSQAHNITIEVQPAGNPDTNNNGIGVAIYESEEMYETGIAAMAIAHSKNPEKVVNVPGSDVNGRTYEDVLIDVVDYIAFGQNDLQTGVENYRGGWGYTANAEYWSDNSVSGYALLGLVYAESPPPTGFGLTIPTFVKTELNYWKNYVQNHDVTDTENYGGSGYTDNSTANILRTGTLLQEMAFVGDTLATPRAQDALNYIERHWDDANVNPGWKGGPAELAYKQAMFTTMKGFTAYNINTITVQRGDPPAPSEVNWFDEMADMLIAQQTADGYWDPSAGEDIDNILSTTWALLVLEKAAPAVAKYALTVQVKDATTKNPIAGATVDVTGPEAKTGPTNATGYAVFLDILTGDYTITASATGYQSNSTTVKLNEDKQIQIELTPVPPPAAATIESCDSAGTKKDSFQVSEAVFVNGSGYSPSTNYDIYIVSDVGTWTDGMTIPSRVAGTLTSVSSDGSGKILPTAAWQSPLTPGKYDIVVDVNGNGKYDADVDALDNNDVEGTAGFVVIQPVVKYDLTVQVKDATTKNPIAGATVDVTGPEAKTGPTNATGYVVFLDLTTGDYTATASATGYQSNSATVTLDQDKQIQIELTPVPPPVQKYDLTVQVKDAVTKNPIAGATVDVAGPEAKTGPTNATGYVDFLELQKGDYTATASATGYQSASASVTLDQDKVIQIELTPIPTLPPTIESSDSLGSEKDSFAPSDAMYVNGSGYAPSTSFDIYVVNDIAVWSDGMTIPPRVPGTLTSVLSDIDGNIPPTAVWNAPLTPGKYDIVVDVNGNGKYDAGVDALDDNDIKVTAGFFVIPEYALGTILGLTAFFAAFGVYRTYKRKHP